LGDFAAARKHFHASVTYWAESTSHPRFLANSLVVAARILVHDGHPERAARLLGLAVAQWLILYTQPPSWNFETRCWTASAMSCPRSLALTDMPSRLSMAERSTSMRQYRICQTEQSVINLMDMGRQTEQAAVRYELWSRRESYGRPKRWPAARSAEHLSG
jgi:hypothetical protein